MSEQMQAAMPGDCGSLLLYDRHCPAPLPPGLDGVGLGGSAPHGFTHDRLDGLRPHSGSPKMVTVTGDNGWMSSGLPGAAGAKSEGAAGGRSLDSFIYGPHGENLTPGRLDSFDQAFAHRRSRGQGPGFSGCTQTPTLRQMLAGVTTSPCYLQARLPLGPHCRPQEAAGLHCAIAQARSLPGFGQRLAQPQDEADGRGSPYRLPHVHQAHRLLQGTAAQPGRGQEMRREDLTLGAGQAQSYICGPRSQFCMTETPRETVPTPVYQQNSHGSPVAVSSASPHYPGPCQRSESENACVQLLDPSTSKYLNPPLRPTELYWEQVHQAPLSCDRVTGQRRGPEEKEEAPYPFNRGNCKDQFRNVGNFQGHAVPGGSLGTSHIVTQTDVEKIPRDSGHFSPHLPGGALAPKALEGNNCGRDGSLLEETSGDFLSGQELTLLDSMVDYSTPESAEDLGAKYPPVTLYRSLLRPGDFPRQSPEHLHFTPRPMLDPTRRGTGLYSSLDPAMPAMPPYPCGELNGFHCASQDNTTQGESQTPCINVGPRFQAVIPELWEKSPDESAVHRAELLWKPWKELAESREVQGQVENLLNLACSSALPGGGLNREFALHCLSEVNGDVLVALEKLLLESGARSTSHQLADYHYPGTSNWTPSEKRLFNKAFAVHKKDFRAIQKVVRTKILAECVEYYYSFKKSLKFNKKLRPRPSDTDEDWGNVIRQDTDYELRFTNPQSVQPAQRADREGPCPTVIGNFPCKQCGKMFYKIKSRNAHMKIHRQQDDWHQGSQEPLCPPTPYVGAALGKQAATPPLYPGWDNRELQGQVEVMSEAAASAGLAQFYHAESKFALNRSKCTNFFL